MYTVRTIHGDSPYMSRKSPASSLSNDSPYLEMSRESLEILRTFLSMENLCKMLYEKRRALMLNFDNDRSGGLWEDRY